MKAGRHTETPAGGGETSHLYQQELPIVIPGPGTQLLQPPRQLHQQPHDKPFIFHMVTIAYHSPQTWHMLLLLLEIATLACSVSTDSRKLNILKKDSGASITFCIAASNDSNT